MKLNAWLQFIVVPLTALSVLAQPAPPPPAPPSINVAPSTSPIAPAPSAAPASTNSTNAPAKVAKKKAKKPTAKAKTSKAGTTEAKAKDKKDKPSTEKKTLNFILNPPATATVKADVLDVRGRGSFAGEVITHVKKGETVTVVEEITLGQAHSNEPTHWSKILLPTNTPVWVSGEFVDSATKTVKAKRINVRGGPGENYSVLGHLEKGTEIKSIRKHDGWMEIEPPTNAFAYVAADYLEMGPETAVAASSPATTALPTPAPTPAPEPVTVSAPPPAPAQPQPTPAPVAAPVANGVSAPAPTAASQADQELAALRRSMGPESTPGATTENPPVELTKPEPFRIETREGVLHRSYNIQSPSAYELQDVKSGVAIEYIQPGAKMNFKNVLGKRVRLTGVELLDHRWPKMPMLVVQTIEPVQ